LTSPLTIVINPAAGGGAAARSAAEVAAILDAAGVRHTVVESKSLDHARSLAAGAAEAGETVVAFGGDGLTGALAGAAAQAAAAAGAAAGAGAAPAFGVIPAGRGNDFARTHRIPFEPAAAARLLIEGEPRPVDLIEVTADGEPATVAGSVYLGIIPVAGEIANRTRFIRGPMVYNLAALRALIGWKPTMFRVEATGADGQEQAQEFRGYCVVAANAPYFGGGMKAAPDADTSDGLLDIVLMRHAPKLTFVRALTKVKDGSHVDLDQVEMLRASSVTLSTDRPMPAGADGELLACAAPLPAGALLRVRTVHNALRLIVPR
jgi:diacylglycerol kinase (ATP)